MYVCSYVRINNNALSQHITFCLFMHRLFSRIIWQETQLSLINRATHMCKCNDVADLTSVIKIRLKWFLASCLSRSLKVGGIAKDRSAMYDFLLVLYSNIVIKTQRFWDIWLQKCSDLEIRVRGPSVKVIGHVTTIRQSACVFYWCSIVTMALSSVVSEIFNVEKCRDLEVRVRCD